MDPADHPFFADIKPADLERILEGAQLEGFSSGQIIFEEGAAPDSLYLILEGQVAFQKRVAGREWLTINESGDGAYFGEIGVLTGEPRALRAVALASVKVLRIPGNVLRCFLSQLSGPVGKLFQSVVQHLERTTDHFVEERLHQEKMSVVGGMVNSIVHDFKNPFCLIRLSAEMVQQNSSEPRIQQLCQGIIDQVGRMVDMAGELAEYSRGESHLVKGPVCLRELLRRFELNNTPYFENERVRLCVEMPAVTVLGSETKLLRVFENLVGNALDAFGERRGWIKIHGTINSADRMAEIVVEDNAGGIPEEIRGRFFEPFVTHGKREGTGLGTAICKSILEAHGGGIRFETESGKGTRFILHLPLA